MTRTCVRPRNAVHSNFHNPAMHSVGIWFRGTVIGGTLRPDDDLDEVRYVSLHRLPENLAFPTDRLVLAQLQQEYIGEEDKPKGGPI
jgi:8-oxo-dGTP diphosphatase